jgi:hypothetical protein
MRRIVAMIAIALVLFGCAPVHRVNPVGSASDRDDVNRALQGRRASIELATSVPPRPSVVLRGESVRVEADSTRMTVLRRPSEITALIGEPTYGARRDTTLSTRDMARVSVRRRWSGAVLGHLRGLLVGASAGAVLGFVSYGEPDLIVGSRADAAGIGAVLLGVVGAGVGLVGGSIWGATEVYDFDAASSDRASGNVR